MNFTPEHYHDREDYSYLSRDHNYPIETRLIQFFVGDQVTEAVIRIFDQGELNIQRYRGIVNARERTFLHLAALRFNNNYDFLRVLLTYSDEKHLNRQDKHGNTALHYACGREYFFRYVCDNGFIRLLIEAGADINITNKEGKTPPDCYEMITDKDPEIHTLLNPGGAATKSAYK